MASRIYDTFSTMYIRADPDHTAAPVLLGAVTMVCIAVLLASDVFLVILGWPAASPDESFAETCSRPQMK